MINTTASPFTLVQCLMLQTFHIFLILTSFTYPLYM